MNQEQQIQKKNDGEVELEIWNPDTLGEKVYVREADRPKKLI